MPEHALPAPPAAPWVLRGGGISYERAALLALVLTFAATALGAYNVGPLPVQWLAQALVIGAAALLSLHHLYRVPGMGLFACLLAWALVVTLANAALRDFAGRMPEMATTPYPVFITLRFLAFLSFAGTVFLVYWLLVRGHQERIVRWIVWIGTAMGAVALYVYVAQLNGWWEPVRSRMGTGGGEQATVFTYAFHRAMGTFREPSQLAEWLVLPFFLSFTYRSRIPWAPTICMGSALLLTGSLTGIVGTLAGLLGAVILTNPFSAARLRLLAQVTLALAVSMVVFDRLAMAYGPAKVGLFEVLQERLEPILFAGGMEESNRGYIYEYVASQPFPVFGAGLGNANIVFAEHQGNPLMVSFISLYHNSLFSVGLVGLVLLAAFLVRPLLGVRRVPSHARDRRFLVLLAAYVAWLVMFGVHSEELAIPFGIVLALLTYEVQQRSAPPAGLATGDAPPPA